MDSSLNPLTNPGIFDGEKPNLPVELQPEAQGVVAETGSLSNSLEKQSEQPVTETQSAEEAANLKAELKKMATVSPEQPVELIAPVHEPPTGNARTEQILKLAQSARAVGDHAKLNQLETLYAVQPTIESEQ